MAKQSKTKGDENFFVSLEKIAKNRTKATDKALFQEKQRNASYTYILDSTFNEYMDNKGENKKYKMAFYWLIFGLLILLTISAIVLSAVLAFRGIKTQEIAIIIAPFATLITSLIVLPKIIAEYLFPKDEFTQFVDILKTIVEKDKANNNNKENYKQD